MFSESIMFFVFKNKNRFLFSDYQMCFIGLKSFIVMLDSDGASYDLRCNTRILMPAFYYF